MPLHCYMRRPPCACASHTRSARRRLCVFVWDAPPRYAWARVSHMRCRDGPCTRKGVRPILSVEAEMEAERRTAWSCSTWSSDTPPGESQGASRLRPSGERATCPVSAGTTGGPSSQILGGLQDDRACFTRWRLAQRNAPNMRQGVQSALARRPPHTGSAPVRIQAVEHGCSSRGRGAGHSPPCLKAGALWPQDGSPRARCRAGVT